MITHPRTEELVQAVAIWIDQIRPQLDPREAFLARVAVNVLSVVERELTLGPAADARARAALADLLGHGGDLTELNSELCRRIREGDFTAESPGLLEALRTIAFDQLSIDQPKYRPEGSL